VNAPPNANRDVENLDVLARSHSAGTTNQENLGSANTVAQYGEAAGSSTRSADMAALGGADWLSLAAAPTFGVMALLVSGGSMSSPLGGMVPMYLLMAVFNSAPWLKLVSSRRNGSRNG
jgi:hypothetical protein